MTLDKIFRAAHIKQEISRVFSARLAAVPGLRNVAVTVRDDARRGLVAEVSADGRAGLNVVEIVREALWGYTVPHEVRMLA